jgi:hypothetical protein
MIADTDPMIVRRCLQPKSGGEYKIAARNTFEEQSDVNNHVYVKRIL